MNKKVRILSMLVALCMTLSPISSVFTNIARAEEPNIDMVEELEQIEEPQSTEPLNEGDLKKEEESEINTKEDLVEQEIEEEIKEIGNVEDINLMDEIIELQSMEDSNKKTDNALQKVREYYSKKEMDYIATMAYNHSSNNLNEDIDTIYSNFRPYEPKNAHNSYKGIMEAIACNMDPRNFEVRGQTYDYVSKLEEYQNEKGKFISYSAPNIEAECILALDMAGGEYDVEKAIQGLKDSLTVSDDSANCDNDLKKTALIMTALSNHTDIDGVQDLIDKCINYIKFKQNDNAGFTRDEPEILGSVIQGLIAVGENPLEGDYVKNGKTMLDVLMEYQNSDGTFKQSTWGNSAHPASTQAAFAALADLSKNSSMYHDLKVEIGDIPANIILDVKSNEVIVGKTLKIGSKVVDIDEKLVPGQNIVWTSSNEDIAIVENGLVTAKSIGSTTIEAKLENNPSISASVEIKVIGREPSELKLYLDNKEVTKNINIKKDESITLSAKVFDKDGEEIEDKEVSWSIVSGSEFINLENGTITGSEKGTASIKVQCGDIEKSLNIEVVLLADIAKGTLDEVKTYIDGLEKIDYLAALSLNHIGEDKNNFSEKISLNSSPSKPKEVAENIIALIAVGKDPRNYEGKNYVKQLIDSQDDSGEFKIGYYPDEEDLIMSIIALDMAGAKYNVEKALDVLKSKVKVYQDTRAFEGRGYINTVEMTSLGIIAMSNHRDNEETAKLIEDCKGYLKSKQNDDGTFEVKKSYSWGTEKSSRATASVIQALIALGENPLGEEWIKNGNSIYDGLLTFKKDNQFKETSTSYSNDKDATIRAFAALADLVENKSMYHEAKIEVGEVPKTIEITSLQDFVKEKQELILAAKVLDEAGKLVPELDIEWSVSDTSLATIDKNGVMTAKEVDEAKEVVVTAKVANTNIETTKNITIKKRIPSKVEITLPSSKKDNNLKEGRQLVLSGKVYEADGEEIKYEELVWTSSNKDAATVDTTGKVTAKNVEKDTKVTITATSKSKPEVKESIELNILAIIPDEIKVYIADEEIKETTIESGFKIKLVAKAFEADKEEIKEPEFVWSIENENIATVDENGIVVAKEVAEEKSTNIKVKVNGFETEKSITLTVIPAQTLQQKTQKVIEELKTSYEAKSKYDYLEALAANRVGIDKANIKNKLNIKEPNFDTGWNGSKSEDYAKAIMGIIAADMDPREYNGKNLVGFLANSQTEEGYFYPNKYSSDKSDEKNADSIAYSILALDMAGADYNVSSAVKALKDSFYIDGDKAYVKGTSYWSSDPQHDKTALALIALSNHKGEEGVEDILQKGKVYLQKQANKWDDKISSKDISYTIQALMALDEDITADSWLQTDECGNKVSMINILLKYKDGNKFKSTLNSTYNDDEATALAFIANIDANKSTSTYKEIKIEVGEPVKVEISSEEDKKEVKVGKLLQLTAKAYDDNDNFVPKQEFTWSSDDTNVAEIDKNTGMVKGIKAGTVNVTAKLKNSDIEETIEIKVIPVVPNKIEVSVDDNISKIEVDKKVKINAAVYDADEEEIENPNIEWTISPEKCATIDGNSILTGLSEGQVTITGKVSKGNGEYISSDAKLDIVIGKTDKERIEETISEVKGYFKTKDKYDFITSMALRYAGVEISEIAKNINVFGYRTLDNDAKNIMNLIAAGENPRDYKDKDYVKLITEEQPEFYKDSNTESVAKAIVALDMASAEYDRDVAINSLIEKLNKDGDKYYTETESYSEYESDSSADNSATAWTLIALSNHQEVEGVKDAIKGIKNYFQSVQESNGLIDACEETSLVIQGIIALGEDPLADEWVQYDKYGNKITLLDGIMDCKIGSRFKIKPENGSAGYSTTQYALAALADLQNNKSMYHELKYVTVGEPEKVDIKLAKQSILIGEELKLEANVYDGDNNLIKDEELIWTSLNPEILKIEDETAIGLKAGEAKVKVELKDNSQVFDEKTIRVEEAEDISLRVKAVLNKLIDFYETYNSFDYMATLSVEHISDDFNVEKLQVKDNLRLYNRDYAIHYAKSIMEIVGAGENPKYYPVKNGDGNVEYKNYIKLLVDSQRENGEFIVNEAQYKDSIVSQSLSIMALDMADARYDEKQAVNRLLEMLGDNKYEIDGLYTEVETRALAITALSNHKNIDGVQTAIDTALKYIKAQQNEDGGFDHCGYKNNPFAIGTVMQALIANDIDPSTWVKDGHTMVEVLLDRQIADGGFEYGENPVGTPEDEIFSEFKCTETAFAALADFYKGKSMYHTIGVDNELKAKLKDEIGFLKTHYEAKKQFEYLAAPAANLAEMDIELLQNHVYEYSNKSALHNSRTVISLIGSGLDPRNYELKDGEIKNYVQELKASQIADGENKGEFIVNEKQDRNSIEALAVSIIALDMAGADYDRVSAVNRLIEMANKKDSSSYTEIYTEAIVLNALAKHKDIDGVQKEVDRLISFLKEKQNDDGGFDIKEGGYQGDNNTLATGRVIQALIANDINPLYSSEWIKNGNTMFDVLLKSKIVHPDRPELNGYSKGEGDEFVYYGATYTVFSALVDLYNNESMFDILAIDYSENSEPEKVEITKLENSTIYLGKTVQLKATVYDKENKVLENAQIEWTSSDDKIATVENGFVTAKGIGEVNIIAKVKDTNIQSKITLNITESNISKMVIEPNVEKLNLEEKVKLTAKVIDDRGDTVEGKEIKWTSSNEKIATVDANTGEVTAIAEGTVEIKAILVGDEKIFDSIEIKVVEEVEETCDIYTAIVVDNGEKYEIKSEPKQVTINTKEHKAGLTALGALQATTDKYVLSGNMITQIFGMKNEGNGGWMFTINDEVPNVYSDKAVIKAGDKVVWFYIKDYNDYKAPTWAKLTDSEEKLSIKITTNKKSIKVGEELPLVAEVRQGEKVLTNKEVQWLNSNAEIAAIDENNRLTAHKAGEVTITAALVEDKNIKDTIKIEVVEKDKEDLTVKEVIESLRGYYSNKDEFKFRPALGYNYTSDNLEKDLVEIGSKLKTNEEPKSASDHVGNIIGLIAAGKDPYNYNNKNYVEPLVKSQNEEGKFVIGQYDDYSTTVAFSMLALDMANANYNRDKAIEALLGYQKDDGSFGGVDETGMVLTALAKYKDKSKVQTAINKGLKYLKEQQDENTGGFVVLGGENPYSASAVLQGLIAVGENPQSEKWTKGGKTIVDSLMNFYKDGHFEKASEWGTEIDSVTEQAFIALADVYKGKSMFNEIKLNTNKVVKITIDVPEIDKIIEGETIKLNVTGYDSKDNIVPVKEIEWTSSDNDIAEVDKNGKVTTKKSGKVTIEAKVKGTEIKDSIELEISEKEFEIEYIGDTEVKNGQQANATIKLSNQTKETKSATLIVALYDKNTNKLLNYSILKKELESNEELELAAGFLVPEIGDYYIKAFLWDDLKLQNIIMHEAKEIKVAN